MIVLGEVPQLVRAALRLDALDTKAHRMGKVVLVTRTHVRWYARGSRHATEVPW